MPQALRTEYVTDVQPPAVARRESVAWWELPPKKEKERTHTAEVRDGRAREWYAAHPQAVIGQCGDSWPPMFIRCYSMI